MVAFIVAALVRISVGSSTVAMTMAAGIIAAMPGINGYTMRRVAYLRPELSFECVCIPLFRCGDPQCFSPEKRRKNKGKHTETEWEGRAEKRTLLPFRSSLLFLVCGLATFCHDMYFLSR